MASLATVVDIVLTVVLLIHNIICSACSHGSFGSSCQYLCHCMDGAVCNTTNGACPGECSTNWFGPACQYASSKFDSGESDASLTWLTDDNVTTCNSERQKLVTVTIASPQFLTWVRVVVKDPGAAKHIRLGYRVPGIKDATYPCRFQQMARVDERTADILCRTSEVVSQLQLSGYGVASLCSLYISVGLGNNRLPGFQLTAYAKENEHHPVFHHRDTGKDVQNVYTVMPDRRLAKPVKSLRIDSGDDSHVLAICDVAAYGETACPAGRFGRECENECNCAGSKRCFVSSGNCPSGCASGYTGEDCLTRCSPGTWGNGCSRACSEFCADQECDHANGACLACPPGKALQACVLDFESENAALEAEKSRRNATILIATSIFVTIIAVNVIVAVIILRRRMRQLSMSV